MNIGNLRNSLMFNKVNASKLALDANFALGSIATQKGPQFTFSRASTATYFDSSGILQTAALNSPRIDYDPVTLIRKGLLLETFSSTNLATNSESLNLWSNFGGAFITSNVANWITNTQIADRFTGTNGQQSYIFANSVSITSGLSYSFSVYAKAETTNFIQLTMPGAAFGTSQYVNFNLSNQTFNAVGGTGSITNVGNGWFRLTFAAAASITMSAAAGVISATNNLSDLRVPTATSTSSFLICGAQFENLSTASSYIPTTSSASIRSADVANITNNTSQIYSRSQGSCIIEFYPKPSILQSLCQFRNSSSNATICLDKTALDAINCRVFNGSSSVNTSSIGSTASVLIKAAFSWQNSSIFSYINSLASSASASPPVIDTFELLSSGQTAQIARIRIYKNKLSNSSIAKLIS